MMNTKRLILFILGILLLITCGPCIKCYLVGPVRLTGYSGDGEFTDQSRRLWVLCISQYSIKMDEFDLGVPFEKAYRMAKLPNTGRDCGFFLGIHDPDDKFLFKTSRQALDSEVWFEIQDETGNVIASSGGKLKDHIWWSFSKMHALYRENGSFFMPNDCNEYVLRITYLPDRKLSDMKGFVYVFSGGI